MPSYSSNRRILINTGDTENILFDISSLSNTRSLICKYSYSENDKLIDSSILRDISYLTLANGTQNIEALFDIYSKVGFEVIYNMFDDLESLHALAFDNCHTLYSCSIPEGIKKIEEYAFNGCGALRHIYLPSTLEEIEEQAFNGCNHLYSINASNVDKLHNYAFAGSGIKNITLNNDITSLPPYLFKNCYNLKIFSNRNIKSLSEGVFSGCINLENIDVDYLAPVKNQGDYKEPIEKPVKPVIPTPGGEDEETPKTYVLKSPRGTTIRRYANIGDNQNMLNEVERLLNCPGVIIQDDGSDIINLIFRDGWVTYHAYNETKLDELSSSIVYEDYINDDAYDENYNEPVFFTNRQNWYIKFILDPITNQPNFKHAILYKVLYEVYNPSGDFVYYIYPNYANKRVQDTINEVNNENFVQMRDGSDNPIWGKYIDYNLVLAKLDSFRLDSNGIPEYAYVKYDGETTTIQYFKIDETVPAGYEKVQVDGYPVYSMWFERFGHVRVINESEYIFYRLSEEISELFRGTYTYKKNKYMLSKIVPDHLQETGIELVDADLTDESEYFTKLETEGEGSGSGSGGEGSGSGSGSGSGGGTGEEDIDNIPSGTNEIPDMLLANCRKLRHDTISFIDQIQIVGYGSFMGCSSLERIDRLILSVEDYGFKDCTNLRSIKLSNCTEIGNYAFKNCILLKSVNLASIGSITNNGIFEDCESLEDVLGNPKISILDVKSFKNCKSLKHYSGFESLTRIEEQAFYNCKKLEEVDLSNVDYIGKFTFCKSGINSLNLKENCIIDDGAFKDCLNLTEITLPSNINKLGDQVFNNCSNLEKITFLSNNIDDSFNMNAFDGCNKVTEITLGENNTRFKSINDICVIDTQNKEIIYIAKGIKEFKFTEELVGYTIKDDAFNNCNVTEINLSEVNAPTITKNIFRYIRHNRWFVFMKETDPNYKQYCKILGYSRVKICV